MYQLGFEEAKKPEIKLPTFTASRRKQESSRKTSTSASMTMLKPLTVWIITNCGQFLEMEIPYQLTCLLRNPYAGQEQQLELDMEQWTGLKLGKDYKVVYCHPV